MGDGLGVIEVSCSVSWLALGAATEGEAFPSTKTIPAKLTSGEGLLPVLVGNGGSKDNTGIALIEAIGSDLEIVDPAVGNAVNDGNGEADSNSARCSIDREELRCVLPGIGIAVDPACLTTGKSSADLKR